MREFHMFHIERIYIWKKENMTNPLYNKRSQSRNPNWNSRG
uniref:Uncharacterized protein n=1 Tax=Arundo donax TaxID=35708 RepID=A0A0A9EWA2_ARUDO